MRVFLGGHGEPIPPIALPDPNVADAAVPVILLPEDGEMFDPADYIPLGYTHYEVWCVGAVGGRGADAAGEYVWDRTSHQEYIPDAEWQKILTKAEENARGSNVTSYSGTVPLGTPMPPEGVISWQEWYGAISYRVGPRGLPYLQLPGRIGTYIEHSNPRPGDSPVTGGGGGGGGLQVVSGRLDELLAPIPITVGQSGSDAVPGQVQANGPYDPVPAFYLPYAYDWYSYLRGGGVSESWTSRYPQPHPTFNPPGFGGDGGYSSFGDICVASGGKGGGPSVIWVGGARYLAAHGGDGGKGGRAAAGGGALGANNPQSNAQGKDGVWDPNTRIGEGGGGGHGGQAEVFYELMSGI